MSLILDALNRSEAERRGAGEIPGLATEHFDLGEPEKGAWRAYVPWAALAAALLVIVWLLLKPASEEVKPGVKDAAVANTATEGTKSLPLNAAEPAAVAAVVPAQTETGESSAPPPPVQDLQTRPQRAPDTVTGTRQAPTQNETGPAANSDPSITALYRQRPAERPASAPEPVATAPEAPEPRAEPVEAAVVGSADSGDAGEQALDLEQVLASAQRELENARLSEHPAPFIEDLSQQRKDAIPTLMYSIHNYSGRAGESTVVLNGKSVKAGDSVGAGVKLAEILPDSIVLEHRGEQFRLRALNSWVNL